MNLFAISYLLLDSYVFHGYWVRGFPIAVLDLCYPQVVSIQLEAYAEEIVAALRRRRFIDNRASGDRILGQLVRAGMRNKGSPTRDGFLGSWTRRNFKGRDWTGYSCSVCRDAVGLSVKIANPG
jgi:hypothetical protein